VSRFAREQFVYRVYGLRLRSNRAILGLVEASPHEAPDLDIRLQGAPPSDLSAVKETAWVSAGDTEHPSDETAQEWRLGPDLPSYLRLRFAIERRSVEFIIDPAGTRVWASWAEGLNFDDCASFLVGPVLGRVLRLRGIPCLHASAVTIDGRRAIAIVGSKAAGKSTTATGLARSGCRVLSDDIAALTEDRGTFLIQPGCPRLRVWNPTINTFYGTRDDLPRVQSNRNKRYLDLSPGDDDGTWRFQPDPLPLAAIYVLGPRTRSLRKPVCSVLSGPQGLLALTGNSYANHVLDRAGRAREFACLGRLAGQVPVRQLERPDDMDTVHELCNVIRADAEQIPG